MGGGDDLGVDMSWLAPAWQEALRVRVKGARSTAVCLKPETCEASASVWPRPANVSAAKKQTEPLPVLGQAREEAGGAHQAHPRLGTGPRPGTRGLRASRVGLGGALRIAAMVRALAWQLFGAAFTDQGIRKLLRHLGAAFQRLGRCTSEAALPETNGSGPVEPTRTRASGPGPRTHHRGCSPTGTGSGNRCGSNAMSAISPTGTLRFTVFEGSFTAPVFFGFLSRPVGQSTKKGSPGRWTGMRCTGPRLCATGPQTTPSGSSGSSYTGLLAPPTP